MSRIAARFSQLKAEGKTALIPYVMAADPYPELTVSLMHEMVAAGASLIELGAPFSDPMADGPVIQAASERSLHHKTSLDDVFAMVSEFRHKDDSTPVIVMGYLNPIEVMGYRAFAETASEAGVDGVITVDMPPEEGVEYIDALKSQGVDPIFLLAPTTTPERMQGIASVASGFLYYVSLKGVTGAANLDVQAVAQKVCEIKTHTHLPVGVGFGISDAESAASVGAIADAVVVGSAIVKKMALKCPENVAEKAQMTAKITKEVTDVLKSMRMALDSNSDNPQSKMA